MFALVFIATLVCMPVFICTPKMGMCVNVCPACWHLDHTYMHRCVSYCGHVYTAKFYSACILTSTLLFTSYVFDFKFLFAEKFVYVCIYVLSD